MSTPALEKRLARNSARLNVLELDGSQQSRGMIWRNVSELDADCIEQWQHLYLRSLSPNVYLSPDFVLSALATFADAEPALVASRGKDGFSALALVEKKSRSLAYPLKSRSLFKTPHSFQTGVLISKDITDAALDAFLYGLLSRGVPSVYLQDFVVNSELCMRLAASAHRQGFGWYEDYRYSRAVLSAGLDIEEWSSERKKRVKEARRSEKRLAERGDLDWRLVASREIGEDSVEAFLELEHDSWKGAEGSSLLARDREAEFFRRLVERLKKRDGIFFTELLLDGEIIASTANLMAGDSAFAFKVAWKRELARFGPGVLNEIKLIERAATGDVPFKQIESGAAGDSYIDALWPGRIVMFSGYLTRGVLPNLLGTALMRLRQMNRRLQTLAPAKA